MIDFPTNKQVFYINFIMNSIGIMFEGITNNDARIFIENYLNKSKKYVEENNIKVEIKIKCNFPNEYQQSLIKSIEEKYNVKFLGKTEEEFYNFYKKYNNKLRKYLDEDYVINKDCNSNNKINDLSIYSKENISNNSNLSIPYKDLNLDLGIKCVAFNSASGINVAKDLFFQDDKYIEEHQIDELFNVLSRVDLTQRNNYKNEDENDKFEEYYYNTYYDDADEDDDW